MFSIISHVVFLLSLLLQCFYSLSIDFHLYFESSSNPTGADNLVHSVFNDFSIDVASKDTITFNLEPLNGYIGIAGTYSFAGVTNKTSEASLTDFQSSLNSLIVLDSTHNKEGFQMIGGSCNEAQCSISITIPLLFHIPDYYTMGIQNDGIPLYLNDIVNPLYPQASLDSFFIRIEGIDIETKEDLYQDPFVFNATVYGPKNAQIRIFDGDKLYSNVGTINVDVCHNHCVGCETTGLLSGACTECKEGYYFLNSDYNQCMNEGDGYFLVHYPDNVIYSRRCSRTCYECTKSETNCLSCANGYSFLSHETNPHRCFLPTDFDSSSYEYDSESNTYICNKYFQLNSDTQKFECISQCDSNLFIVQSTKQCVSQCPSGLLTYNNLCLDSCPRGFSVSSDNAKCESKYNDKMTDKDKDELIPTIPDLIKDNTLKQPSAIQGDDYTFQIVNTSNVSDIRNELSSIDLGQCEIILRKEYGLDDNDDIIVAKFDYYIKGDNDDIVDQVEYLVYDSKGNKLDISVCKEKNVTISISYPIDIDDDVKEAAKDMLNDGIDVFNSKDEFFNDICSTYVTENNTDVILKDRRADFYKNFSFCEEGCDYESFNYTTSRVKCNCEIKTEVNDIKEKTNNYQSFISNISSMTNISIVKCYKVLTHFYNLKSNIGFWMISSILFIQIMMVFIFYFHDTHKLYLKLFFPLKRNLICCGEKEEKSKVESPKKMNKTMITPNSRNINISIYKSPSHQVKSSMDIFHNDISSFQNASTAKKLKSSSSKKIDNNVFQSINMFTTTSNINKTTSNPPIQISYPDEVIETNNNNVVIEDIEENETDERKDEQLSSERKEILHPQSNADIDYLPYKDAVENDKRNVFKIFCSVLSTKIELVSMIFFTSYFDLLSLSISTYLLSLSLEFLFNAILFSDDVISERYHNGGSMDSTTSLILSILSEIIAYLFNIVFRKLTFYSPVLDILSEKYSLASKYEIKCHKCIQTIKVKMFIFYITNFIIVVFIWYYLSIFCAVFSSSQINWFIDGVVGNLIQFVAMILIVVSITAFRYIALNCYSQKLYHTSLYLNKNC